jgi:hypothetical protein
MVDEGALTTEEIARVAGVTPGHRLGLAPPLCGLPRSGQRDGTWPGL